MKSPLEEAYAEFERWCEENDPDGDGDLLDLIKQYYARSLSPLSSQGEPA